MSAQPQNKPHSRPVKRARRITAPQITARKGGEPVVCLTAYDAPTAEIMDEHVDLILVGDSLGMVVQGASFQCRFACYDGNGLPGCEN